MGQDGEKLFLLPHLNLYAVWDSFLSMPQSWRHCYRVLTAYLFSKSDPWLGLHMEVEENHHRHRVTVVTRHIIGASVTSDVWELTRDC